MYQTSKHLQSSILYSFSDSNPKFCWINLPDIKILRINRAHDYPRMARVLQNNIPIFKLKEPNIWGFKLWSFVPGFCKCIFVKVFRAKRFHGQTLFVLLLPLSYFFEVLLTMLCQVIDNCRCVFFLRPLPIRHVNQQGYSRQPPQIWHVYICRDLSSEKFRFAALVLASISFARTGERLPLRMTWRNF